MKGLIRNKFRVYLLENDSNIEGVGCIKKFGKELFGDEFGGSEKNNEIEKKYVKLIQGFGDTEFGAGISSEFIDAMFDIKRCKEIYSEILEPTSGLLYRGAVLPLRYFIKNKLKLSSEGIDYTYKPKTSVQSFSASEEIASGFVSYYLDELNELGKLFMKYSKKGLKYEDKFFTDVLLNDKYLDIQIPVIYETSSDNPDFLFKYKYLTKLTGEDEQEVIRVSEKPINVKLKVNTSRMGYHIRKFAESYNQLIDYGLDNGDPYNPSINESIDRTIKCGNCGWSWKESTSEPDDLYNCHKCGHDNQPKNINEGITKSELINIENDDLYDSLEKQAEALRSNSEISFGSADPYEVLYDETTGELVGATWIETSGVFSPHMIIKPKYRGLGLSKTLIDGVVDKYKKMKEMRGDGYLFMLNVVNKSLVKTMENYYGFRIINKDPKGNTNMTI